MSIRDKLLENARQHAPLEKGFQRLLTPFDIFFKSQAGSGILLLFSASLAIYFANSEFKTNYDHLGHLPFGLKLADWYIEHSIHHWVNDGLMVFFFFLLGLEIKREVLAGELREIKQSILVIFMALGGMVIPALVYVTLSGPGIAVKGWGIPMATDTAFALGALALLGTRAPRSAAVLLSALAIVDDIGAVLVISIFYTSDINFVSLCGAGVTLMFLCLLNLLGVRKPIGYLIGGLVLWWWIHNSGVHATTAGIIAALTVPSRPYADTSWFSRRIRTLLRRFERLDHPNHSILEENKQHEVIEQVQQVAAQTTTPLQHWGTILDKPVTFVIVPIFAFLNAGVTLPSGITEYTDSPVMWAVALGLVLGKGLGISLFAWMALKFGLAKLPKDMNFMQLIGLALLAGMGFTMSLFIAALAFEGNIQLLTQAKIGILFGSMIAGVLGVATLFYVSKKRPQASLYKPQGYIGEAINN